MEPETTGLSLPLSIVTPGDLNRTRRELKALEDYIEQAQLRRPGTPLAQLPKVSAVLSDFASVNKLNFLHQEDRNKALAFTEELYAKGPRLQISFAVDPSARFMQKIIAWFRGNIHPLLIINIGLEPAIAAGCTIKTDNHFHDFSLREHFNKQHPLLLASLKEN